VQQLLFSSKCVPHVFATSKQQQVTCWRLTLLLNFMYWDAGAGGGDALIVQQQQQQLLSSSGTSSSSSRKAGSALQRSTLLPALPNRQQPEVLQDGTWFPASLSSQHDINCVLTQQPGKLRTKDIKASGRHGLASL
jgi:hypothetical protein